MKVNFRNTSFWGTVYDTSSCPPSDKPEIVLSGKSNVGKSSLINALSDNKKLARVSQTPGKTRSVVYFEVDKKLYIADLPGYGYAKVSKELRDTFSKIADDYFASGRPFSLVLHLIDIRHSPSKEDVAMLGYLNATNIPYFVVFTKCDKFSKQELQKRLKDLNFEYGFQEDAIIYAISSSKKVGIEDLRAGIEDFLCNINIEQKETFRYNI